MHGWDGKQRRFPRMAALLGAPALVLALLAAGAGAGEPPPGELPGPVSARTPHSRRAKLDLGGVERLPETLTRGESLDLSVRLDATFDNPFDPADVLLDARFETPSATTLTTPGFYYQGYTRALMEGREVLAPMGEPEWRVRFTPQEAGPHTLVLMARDRTGMVLSRQYRFRVREGTAPPFVRVSRRDGRYLETADGRAFFPVGVNLCWAGPRGTFDYDDWLPPLAEAGCNTARLWLSPHWATFAMEKPGAREQGRGLGLLDLGAAWRLDHVVERAERVGVRLVLCLDSYNILRERDAYPEWERTPHNALLGGPLKRPVEFWNDPVMDRLYRARLRYLVARYGGSPRVLAWEFWNEVDAVSDYDPALVREWHARMATVLRGLDPTGRPLMTSFARAEGEAEVDRLPGLDVLQTHHYGGPDPAAAIAAAHHGKRGLGKPHWAGEVGADAAGARGEVDPEGLQVHDALWISVATGMSGTAQPWWWDSYLLPRGLHRHLLPVTRWIEGIDWPAEGFEPVNPAFAWQVRPEPLPRGDARLEGGPVSWAITEYNRPRAVRLTRMGLVGQLPVAGIQHGTVNHPDKHNPVTFRTDLPYPVQLEVEVGDVSGHGGAVLRVTVDGREVLRKEFADTDPGTRTLTQYAGSFSAAIPPGRHTVVVENVGTDWFLAGYRFRAAVERAGPPVEGWAVAGRRNALAWARVEGRTWRRLLVVRDVPEPAPPCLLRLPRLSPGEWDAEVWDTWDGRVLDRQPVTVGPDGVAQVRLAAMQRDFGVRLRRR